MDQLHVRVTHQAARLTGPLGSDSSLMRPPGATHIVPGSNERSHVNSGRITPLFVRSYTTPVIRHYIQRMWGNWHSLISARKAYVLSKVKVGRPATPMGFLPCREFTATEATTGTTLLCPHGIVVESPI